MVAPASAGASSEAHSFGRNSWWAVDQKWFAPILVPLRDTSQGPSGVWRVVRDNEGGMSRTRTVRFGGRCCGAVFEVTRRESVAVNLPCAEPPVFGIGAKARSREEAQGSIGLGRRGNAASKQRTSCEETPGVAAFHRSACFGMHDWVERNDERGCGLSEPISNGWVTVHTLQEGKSFEGWHA